MKKINIIRLFYVIIFSATIEASKSNTPPLNNKYADAFQKLSTGVNQRSFSPEK
ncbi:MAG: hypothetical protein Q8Q60_00490 [Candidatus Chromulinivorax sp.]|nr:hypothetical protein [Candidatus Chromulinivorax sp.]